MRDRVTELYDRIRTANEELERIRKTCPHPNTYLALYSWRIGAMHPAHLCEDCDFVVRLADDKESEEFYKNEQTQNFIVPSVDEE
jgi:hypothetical protein